MEEFQIVFTRDVEPNLCSIYLSCEIHNTVLFDNIITMLGVYAYQIILRLIDI